MDSAETGRSVNSGMARQRIERKAPISGYSDVCRGLLALESKNPIHVHRGPCFTGGLSHYWLGSCLFCWWALLAQAKHTRSFAVPDVFQEDSSCFAFGTLLEKVCRTNKQFETSQYSWFLESPDQTSDDHNILREFNVYSRCFFPPNKMDTISSNVPTTSIEFTFHGDATSQRPSSFPGHSCAMCSPWAVPCTLLCHAGSLTW